MMMMEMEKTSWQERYHASEIYTLRCKVHDTPGMLGKLITAIGQTRTHLGNISIIGVESHSKIRDIQVYCSNKKHLKELLEKVDQIEGVQVLSIKDNVLEIHRRGAIEIKSRVPIRNLTDLRMLYTPGVASVCNKIVEDPNVAWELTGNCDRVAIVTNGTAVLGLGSIGVLPSPKTADRKSTRLNSSHVTTSRMPSSA